MPEQAAGDSFEIEFPLDPQPGKQVGGFWKVQRDEFHAFAHGHIWGLAAWGMKQWLLPFGQLGSQFTAPDGKKVYEIADYQVRRSDRGEWVWVIGWRELKVSEGGQMAT